MYAETSFPSLQAMKLKKFVKNQKQRGQVNQAKHTWILVQQKLMDETKAAESDLSEQLNRMCQDADLALDVRECRDDYETILYQVRASLSHTYI